jgi:hypothetical protein
MKDLNKFVQEVFNKWKVMRRIVVIVGCYFLFIRLLKQVTLVMLFKKALFLYCTSMLVYLLSHLLPNIIENLFLLMKIIYWLDT